MYMCDDLKSHSSLCSFCLFQNSGALMSRVLTPVVERFRIAITQVM